MTVKAIENAGPDLTTQKLVEGMENIRNYQDIFGGPPQGFSATEHVSSREAVIYRVEKGRWVRLPDSVAVAK